MYYKKIELIDKHFGSSSINSGDIKVVQNILSHEDIFKIISEIIENDELLEKIANRSYTHALGFDKIVLMDLSKDLLVKKQKTQVRLHIWNPQNNSLPIVESLHEHSFDFISTVLSGHLENQMFLLSKLNPDEELVLFKLSELLKKLDKKEIIFLNEQVEILEALGLSKIGSKQFESNNMSTLLDLNKIRDITGFDEKEIMILPKLEGHFVSNRISGERSDYKHVLKDHISLTPYSVFSLNKGDFYFHPYQMPHRLYYDNKVLNSTVLITTPVLSNPAGGSLQRPTYIQDEEQSYNKKPFEKETLRNTLNEYLKFINDIR